MAGRYVQSIITALLQGDAQAMSGIAVQAPKSELNSAMFRTIFLTNNADLLEILLDAGADVNYQDREGRTALFLAVKYERMAMARLLTQRHCDIHLYKHNQSSTLHLAAKNGNPEIVEMLAEAGHKLNVLNWGGNSALLIACRFGHRVAVQQLVGAGADLNICNKLGHYPLHYAAFVGDGILVQFLLAHGANPDARTHLGITPMMLACERKQCVVVQILAPLCDLQHREQLYGGTALHWAVASGCLVCVECLLTHGADLHSLDHSGRTPVMEAVQSSHKHQARILQLLLANLAQEDFSPGSPNEGVLHLVAYLGHTESVVTISECRATKHLLNHRDVLGNTPLDFAIMQSNKETLVTLLQRGATVCTLLKDIDPGIFSIGSTDLSGDTDRAGTSPLPSACPQGGAAVKRTDQIMTSLGSMEDLAVMCMESWKCQTFQDKKPSPCHKIYKTYSAVKMAMLDMLRMSSKEQLVAPVKFDFNTWLDNGPEAFVLKVTSLDLTDWIQDLMHRPWSLQERCRACVRRTLGYRASDKVHLLPLPGQLKDFLNMKELDDIQTGEIRITHTSAFDGVDLME